MKKVSILIVLALFTVSQANATIPYWSPTRVWKSWKATWSGWGTDVSNWFSGLHGTGSGV